MSVVGPGCAVLSLEVPISDRETLKRQLAVLRTASESDIYLVSSLEVPISERNTLEQQLAVLRTASKSDIGTSISFQQHLGTSIRSKKNRAPNPKIGRRGLCSWGYASLRKKLHVEYIFGVTGRRRTSGSKRRERVRSARGRRRCWFRGSRIRAHDRHRWHVRRRRYDAFRGRRRCRPGCPA